MGYAPPAMIARIGSALNRWSRRWVPDPFVLCLGLTLFVIGIGVIRIASGSAPTTAGTWAGTDVAVDRGMAWTIMGGWIGEMTRSVWLAFALKMCLILVTGHALALSPPVQRLIRRIARVPKTAAGATLIVSVVACLSALVHWGLGAIAGALLAREIGRNSADAGLKVHYPLLGAAAYTGLAVWHGGFTGSAPTKVAGAGHAHESLIGVVPMSGTVFSGLNLLITGALVLCIPALLWALTPKDEREFVPPDEDQLKPLPERTPQPIDTPVHWLLESNVPGTLVGGAGVLALLWARFAGHMEIKLDWVVLFFVFLSLAVQGSLRHYVDAIADGARGAGAIILQFPFYFGILGVMKATGMVKWISDFMVDISSSTTLPVFTFLSAGLVNMFVPSGGGQWAVQGDIVLNAGAAAGVDPTTTIMAFSYGDQWSNMLQPFWALPLLGIMGLRARDIIGYTAVVFIMMGILVPVLLVIAG